MAASVFDFSSNAELRTLLETDMQYQQWRDHKFSRWMAPNYVKYDKIKDVGSRGMEAIPWTGAPIEMQDAFIQQGRTDMLIPIRSRLSGSPVFGNTVLKGKAEAAAYGFRSVRINQTRKAYAPPTGYELQKTKQWKKNLVGGAHTDLSKWLSDWTATNVQQTMCTGYSLDLTMPAAAGGLAITAVSHPNFFAAGQGQVGLDSATGTYTAGSRPGTSGYETAIETALNTLNAGGAGTSCTADFITAIVHAAARLKINPVVMSSGFSFYPVWLKDSAWIQLQKDPGFQSLAKSLYIKELAEHPLGNGMVAYLGGAAIFTDMMLYNAYTNAMDSTITAGTVQYGKRPSAANYALGWTTDPTAGVLDSGVADTINSNCAIGFLIGESALTIGTGEKVNYTEQLDDHENVQEIGIRMIQSVVRNETYDTLGILKDNISGAALTAGLFYENTSSLVFATNSPYALSM
jgi:hypothetical protein